MLRELKLFCFSELKAELQTLIPKNIDVEKGDPKVWEEFAQTKGPKRFKLLAKMFESHPIFLAYTEDGFYMLDSELGEFHLDFLSPDYNRKILADDPFLKAIGKSKHILDMTAGLLKDSFVFLKKGLHVLAIEQDPLVFMLVSDAVARDSRIKRLKMRNQDSLALTADDVLGCDCIYLDPMFEEVSESALPQKDFQFMRKIIEHNNEDLKVANEKLLRKALSLCSSLGIGRVVVKRPVKASALLFEPNLTFAGKAIRYDVYLEKSLVSKARASL